MHVRGWNVDAYIRIAGPCEVQVFQIRIIRFLQGLEEIVDLSLTIFINPFDMLKSLRAAGALYEVLSFRKELSMGHVSLFCFLFLTFAKSDQEHKGLPACHPHDGGDLAQNA